MEKTRILIEEDSNGTKVEIDGKGKDVLRCLSLAVYDLHKSSNTPINKIVNEIANGATVYKIMQWDNKDKLFSDILDDLLEYVRYQSKSNQQ